jgi:ring-1,2-phenylacetyl-CoA epoxidase subunit PaaE
MADVLPTYTPLIVTSIKDEATDVKTFELERVDGKPVDYKSGQFVTLVKKNGDSEERRSYSLSSCGTLNEQPAITVKRVDNGVFSRYLHDKVVQRDVLLSSGIGGFFTLPDITSGYKQYVFFAAGVGITPVLPLIKTLLHENVSARIVLIYSNSSPNEVVFMDALLLLQKSFSNRFLIEFLYSNAFNLARARLSKSLLRVFLNEYSISDMHHSVFYVCGPHGYMRMVTYALQEAGAKPEQIHKEHFNTTDRISTLPQPPDAQTHIVTIHYKQHTYHIPVSYPNSILQAAKQHGLSLPYSCEVGRCGSCAAICTAGKVWHSYNEVLMDVELQKGCVLTCTGHPVGGNVVIAV